MLESYLFLHVYLKAIDSHTHFHDFTDNLQFWLPLLRAYYVPNTLFVIYLTWNCKMGILFFFLLAHGRNEIQKR